MANPALRPMDYLTVGTIAFVLFYMFDLYQIKKLPEIFRFCFLPGCAMLAYALVGLIFIVPEPDGFSRLNYLFLIPAAISLLAAVYSLFFALPADKTYSAESGRRLIDRGVYALCRHPGVLPLSLTFFFFWLSFQKAFMFNAFILWSAANLLLVAAEDRYIFPKLFEDYEDYKRRVPFLMPTKESLRQCIADLKIIFSR